jgi:hypothetical protein
MCSPIDPQPVTIRRPEQNRTCIGEEKLVYYFTCKKVDGARLIIRI